MIARDTFDALAGERGITAFKLSPYCGDIHRRCRGDVVRTSAAYFAALRETVRDGYIHRQRKVPTKPDGSSGNV